MKLMRLELVEVVVGGLHAAKACALNLEEILFLFLFLHFVSVRCSAYRNALWAWNLFAVKTHPFLWNVKAKPVRAAVVSSVDLQEVIQASDG